MTNQKYSVLIKSIGNNTEDKTMTMYERRFQEINMELEKLPLLFDMTDEQHARFEQLCEELFAVVPHIGTTNTQEQVERNAANARFVDDYERSIDYELSF